jgi:copper chaperone CopZ
MALSFSTFSFMSTAEQHTLEIDGMHCEHCVAAVRSTLESLEALTVQDVEVGTAQVTYDPAEISTDQLAEAIDDAGFDLVR